MLVYQRVVFLEPQVCGPRHANLTPGGPALSMAKAAHSLGIIVQRPARGMFAAEILVQLGKLLSPCVCRHTIPAIAEVC